MDAGKADAAASTGGAGGQGGVGGQGGSGGLGDAGRDVVALTDDAGKDAGALSDSIGKDAAVLPDAASDVSSKDITLDAFLDGTGKDATSADGPADVAGKDTTVPADAPETGSADALPAPTFSAEMTSEDRTRFFSRSENGGSVTFGVANASAADNKVVELVFHGDPALGPADRLSPAYATEIGTNDESFRYGTYRTRVQLARCGGNEELVNGIFTYFNDGADHDGDGLFDNSEIDIEILCSDPSIISLTIWSEYTSDAAGKSQHVSRTIRTKTGEFEDTLNYETELGTGNNPEFKQTGFPDPEAFYEMGFEWHATSLRYFMVLGGKEVTLWTFTDAKYIPTLAAPFLFNVWHSDDWWNSKATGDYPMADAVMRVDWLRYWRE